MINCDMCGTKIEIGILFLKLYLMGIKKKNKMLGVG